MVQLARPNFHPVIESWFTMSFGHSTDVQRRAWAAIAGGRHTLIASPTGTGKTLAALLPCLDAVVRDKLTQQEREPGVRVLVVTPLKALNNDIHHHVERFAREMDERAAGEAAGHWPGIRVAVRTGDTTQSSRAAMLRRPPDVLVTTPESLYLLLTSRKGRVMLRTVRHAVVDEIHALAADKRGVHLTLSLERLTDLVGRPLQRIGISATQKPVERVARFLGGWEEANGNDTAAGAAIASEGGTEAGSAGVADSMGDADAETQRTAGAGSLSNAGSAADAGSAAQADGLGCDGATVQSHSGAVSLDGMRPRPVVIVESRVDKTYDLLVTMPETPKPTNDKETLWTPLVDKLLRLMEGTRTALVFVNSRRLCERLTLRLNDHAGYEMARSHHGSVSREKRLEVERMLKAGELRCLVATSSLELGIDVGHVDLVLQIDSPKQAAAGIQRIGRAGHAVGDASRGVIVARTRGELPEAAVLARQIAARDIEEIRVPRHSLDVLSQHVVAMVATDDWELGRLARVVGRSDCYRGFPRDRLEAMLEVLAGLYPFARPLIEWDRDADVLRRRSGTGLAALTGAGTIPQSSAYPVHHAESRVHVGELDETFVFESRVGDVFQLGSNSWMIRQIKNDRVYVTEAANSFSEVPFWQAEAPSRTVQLGEKVGEFLEEIGRRLSGHSDSQRPGSGSPAEPQPASGMGLPALSGRQLELDLQHWLGEEYHLDPVAADSLVSLVKAQQTVCPLPTARRIVLEHYTDESGQHHLVFHCLFGRKMNRTWQLAIQTYLEKILPYRMYASAKDNGFELVFPEWDDSWLGLIREVDAVRLEELLSEAVPASPLWAIAFRRLAETSLLLSRGFARMPSWKLRLRSEELLKEALPYADRFPLLREAMDECLEQSLDVRGLKRVLDALDAGDIVLTVRHSRFPSPFAAQFAMDFVGTAIYEGDALGKDVQLRLLGVSRTMAAEWFGASGLAPLIPVQVLDEERSRLTGADGAEVTAAAGLERLLKERGDMTVAELRLAAGEEAARWLGELRDSGRAVPLRVGGEERWICRDERDTYASLPNDARAVTFVVKRYADRQLSFTAEDLAARYDLPAGQAAETIGRWREEGEIEPAPFAESADEGLWTSRKVASRIVRLSLRRLRGEAEPVASGRLCGLLLERHRLLPEDREPGVDGLKAAIDSLQGLFLPLTHWESVIFPSRLPDYRKERLDLLCASGEVIWFGKKDDAEKDGKIAFFLADSKTLYAPLLRTADGELTRSEQELLDLLERKGASFLSALSRETAQTPSDLLETLLRLVWAGRVANDQFAPMRLRSAGRASGTPCKSFASGLGRWYALSSLETDGVTEEQAAVGWAHQLLRQRGVLTREAAAASPYAWDTLYGVLRRLEDWGLVVRGMFVRGVESIQFATRESVELLREAERTSSLVLLPAVDPANPYGLTLPWPVREGSAFARKPGNYIAMEGGNWRYWIENNGRRIIPMDDEQVQSGSAAVSPASLLDGEVSRTGAGAADFRDLCRAILRYSGLRKLTFEEWDGTSAAASGAAPLYESIGAERDRAGYVLWPSSIR